jgi:hypothetical protein
MEHHATKEAGTEFEPRARFDDSQLMSRLPALWKILANGPARSSPSGLPLESWKGTAPCRLVRLGILASGRRGTRLPERRMGQAANAAVECKRKTLRFPNR